MDSNVGVIFDNDGVIVDTEPLHYQARVQAFAALGLTLTRETYIRHMMSRHHTEALGNTVPSSVLPPERYDAFFHDVIQANYLRLLEDSITAIPDARNFIHRMSDTFVTGVASTQPRAVIEQSIRAVVGSDTLNRFRALCSGEDVRQNKPAPDVYLAAAEKMGVNPAHCVAIEDSVSGVLSARRAGMACIGRISSWSTPLELHRAGANQLVSSYERISPHMIRFLIRVNVTRPRLC